MTARLRLLFVVQRYGEDVLGGSEHHARLMAERLALAHDVEVATTTALDYWTWQPHFAPGESDLNGVHVRRFPVAAGRAPDFKAVERRVVFERHAYADELAFLRAQGPTVPALHEFLHREGERYNAILFYTYIYAPTALGLPLVPERAILVSTAHDERPLHLAPYRALFHLPRALAFLSAEERDLVHQVFRNEHIPHEVLGIGLDPAPRADPAEFRAVRGLSGPLVLYLGQVTEAKACDELVAHFSAARERGLEATLVLCGEVRMTLPERTDIVALGRVSDDEKWQALAAADVLVLPSHLESLGIVLLEAWQVGTPVLVPGWNAVTAGQVARSGGGLTYRDVDSFAAALQALARDGAAAGARGKEYVEREYGWDAVGERLDRLLASAAVPA